ncbi:MAG: hypothetical protein NC548_66035 [Lachnospiraceae bacterium]|nr:hypothetical protein [Lachnospiraceae bacterium]
MDCSVIFAVQANEEQGEEGGDNQRWKGYGLLNALLYGELLFNRDRYGFFNVNRVVESAVESVSAVVNTLSELELGQEYRVATLSEGYRIAFADCVGAEGCTVKRVGMCDVCFYRHVDGFSS